MPRPNLQARAKGLFREDRRDPIPGWLIGFAFLLGAVAIIWGLRADPEGFLLNIAATIVVLGPGLFITNRITRGWRDEPLRYRVRELAGHLLRVLNLLSADLESAGLTGRTIPAPERGPLARLRGEAAAWGKDLEDAALTAQGNRALRRPAAEQTLSRATDRLGESLTVLDGRFQLGEAMIAWRHLSTAATDWDQLRDKPADEVRILLCGRVVVGAVQRLAGELETGLPAYLT